MKDLGEEMRYTPVKSSKAKKELHNHVRSDFMDFSVPRTSECPGLQCAQDFRVPRTSECPGLQSAQGRRKVVSSVQVAHYSTVRTWENFEEKQNSDWCKLGEEDNFLARILAPAQWVLSRSALISTLSPCFHNSFFACDTNSSQGCFGTRKLESWKHDTPGRMKPTLTGALCERAYLP